MKIFKELKKLGYIHYSATTIEELDDLPLNSAERVSEQALVFRWFREKYGLFVAPNAISYENGPYLWFFEINSTVLPFGTDLGETDDYKTYEEAELECLKKLIQIIENK
jgi:hypothetical protein